MERKEPCLCTQICTAWIRPSISVVSSSSPWFKFSSVSQSLVLGPSDTVIHLFLHTVCHFIGDYSGLVTLRGSRKLKFSSDYLSSWWVQRRYQQSHKVLWFLRLGPVEMRDFVQDRVLTSERMRLWYKQTIICSRLENW